MLTTQRKTYKMILTNECPEMRTVPAIGSKEDHELLRLVGRSQSHAAFESLFSRYENRAYGLAYHLSGSQEAAKDIVQEAMITVWKKAGSYDPKRGPAAGWILRIVANVALKFKRKSHSLNRIEQDVASKEREHATADGIYEKEALQHSLHGIMKALPEVDRNVLALYFGGELSQYEIARKLSLSQRTISEKMKKALESIRMQLAKAGFASISLAHLGQEFSTYMQNGCTPPTALQAQVLQRIQELQTNQSAHLKASHMIAWALPALALIGLGIVASNTSNSTTLLAKEPAQKNIIEPAIIQDANTAVPLFEKAWIFTTPASPDAFKVIEGSWRHVSSPKKGVTGHMRVDKMVHLELNWPIIDQPFVITYTCGVVPGGGMRTDDEKNEYFMFEIRPAREDILNGGPIRNLRRGFSDIHPTFKWSISKKVIANDFEETWKDDLQQTLAYRKFHAGGRLHLILSGAHCLASLQIRALRTEEIPDNATVRAAIERIPQSKRKGDVNLPSLTSLDPKFPVFIQFPSSR